LGLNFAVTLLLSIAVLYCTSQEEGLVNLVEGFTRYFRNPIRFVLSHDCTSPTPIIYWLSCVAHPLLIAHDQCSCNRHLTSLSQSHDKEEAMPQLICSTHMRLSRTFNQIRQTHFPRCGCKTRFSIGKADTWNLLMVKSLCTSCSKMMQCYGLMISSSTMD